MDKAESKVRGRNSKISIIVLILLCILVGEVAFYFFRASDKLSKEIVRKQDVINNLNQEIVNKQEDVDSSLKELDDIANIDERIVEVRNLFFENASKAEQMVKNGEANFKICYLTFDDGPYTSTTNDYLDVLERYDVQATFFLMKREGEEYEKIYRREMINGHTLGNHTASHQISHGIYRSNKAFIDDILENREYIKNMLGYETEVMRFPGGSYQATYSGLNKSELVGELSKLHYGYVDWNLMTGDGGAVEPPEVFLHNVIDYSANFPLLVILMHDYSYNTLECLPEMIETLSDQGFIFLPLFYDSVVVKKS